MAERPSVRSRTWRRLLVAGAVVAVAGTGALAPVAAGAVDPSADLSVTVGHAPDPATAPVDVTFTLTASNAGPDTAEGVVVGLGYRYPLEVRTLPEGCRRSSSYESVVCDLGDLASGASESIDLVLYARGSGLFTLPVAITSDTPDPDATDRTATDTLLVKPGPSQAERYIRGIFPAILQRNPNQATTDYWAARWKAANAVYPSKAQQVPASIINSNEYRRLRIRESYQRILARTVDPSALAYWTTKAAAGWSYERIDTTLLSSAEFRRNTDLEAAIRKTYVAVLGRQPTTAELARWKNLLAPTDTIAWTDFPRSLQRSTEGFDVIIKQRYVAATGEQPNSLVRYIWQAGLRNGQTPEKLWAQLFVSYDVLKKYPYTDDDYEEEEFEYALPASDVQAAVDAAAGAPAPGVSFGS